MFQDGKEATAKCNVCGQVGRGATFKVSFFSPHLCAACIAVVRDMLAGWVERLSR